MMRREASCCTLIPVIVAAVILSLGPCLRATEELAPRPRLFFTPEKVTRLRQRIEQEDRFRQAWLRIQERADRQLKDKLVSKERAEGGTGQHGNYGEPSSQIANMASTLGLAYRMTGNKEYAQKLKEALLQYGELARWAGDAGNVPPWHSELNTATVLLRLRGRLRLHL